MVNYDDTKIIENIKEITELLDENKVKWWLEHGSCLGLIRDKKFLNDNDIDIGIKTNNDGILDKIRDRYGLMAGYFKTRSKKLRYMHIDRKARIDVLNYFKDNKSYYSIRKEEDKHYLIKRIPFKYLDKVKKVKYKGKKYKVPNYPKDYLRYVYGEDWKIPNPQGRSIYKIEKLKKC